ncbi:unnamed protein product [Rhizoctonia solani]|uniref:Uncharacterized protein n=1 Tax=Rhizoctonia solani TaxID=456999 RepID=A0A8H3HQT9_9AGAM|nr:unnamed protein product [Rhizoctonia solani]
MSFRNKVKEKYKRVKNEFSSFLKVKAKAYELKLRVVQDRTLRPVQRCIQTPWLQLSKLPKDISNVDKPFDGLVELNSPTQEVQADVNIGGRAFDSDMATLTVPGPSELPVVEVSLATPVSGHVDPVDTNVPEIQKPGDISPVVPEAPSAKWKGLKEFARVLEPVSNLFGPIKETVDLSTECVDKYEVSLFISILSKCGK